MKATYKNTKNKEVYLVHERISGYFNEIVYENRMDAEKGMKEKNDFNDGRRVGWGKVEEIWNIISLEVKKGGNENEIKKR